MICHLLKPVVNLNADTANVKLFLLHNLHLCETAHTRVHLGRTTVNLTFHLSYNKDWPDVFLAAVVHSMLYRSSNLLSKKFATINCRWKGAVSVRQLSVAHVRSISDWGEILEISTTVGGSSGLLRGCAQGSPSICKYPMERLPLISRRTASAFVHMQKHCQLVEQNSITTTTFTTSRWSLVRITWFRTQFIRIVTWHNRIAVRALIITKAACQPSRKPTISRSPSSGFAGSNPIWIHTSGIRLF